jgi:hypothetical protein
VWAAAFHFATDFTGETALHVWLATAEVVAAVVMMMLVVAAMVSGGTPNGRTSGRIDVLVGFNLTDEEAADYLPSG